MNNQNFNIGSHNVGGGRRCFIIGEVAQSHDGSLGMAHAFIDAIAKAGADAVKFQTHIAQEESSLEEPWRVRFSSQDSTRFDYWKRMEFKEEHWFELKKHAEDKGLVFLSSPFSEAAVNLLARMKMEAWKIASGEITNHRMLEQISKTGKPILLSTGMSGYAEIDKAVELVKQKGNPLAVLQCTTSYPTAPEKIGLNLLAEYRERYGCAVGLSDHSATIYAGLAAATLEADILEIHVTMSREMFGPDVVASVTSAELKQLVEGVRFIEKARSHPINKDALAPDFQGLKQIFNKSLFAALDLAAGTALEDSHFVLRKPGTGITAEQLPQVVGRRLANSLKKGQMIRMSDLSPQADSSNKKA